ncbi:MAG: LysR family transcriptional regulator [Crocinitomicaceae bacterium]|nr:MAG: LysR family transcriptional regulator [Crocinitomicaceae bacterium]
MFSSQQIQYILTLTEVQNFSRAAEACFVTQPTLSMQIKKAEEAVGFPIFDRNTNPLELTIAGKNLIPLLREIAADYELIERLKKQMQGNFIEEIRIGIIPTISAYLIPKLYETWQAELPTIKLTIEEKKSEEILESIQHKKIDFGIMAGPVHDERLKSIQLYQEEIKAFIPTVADEIIEVDKLRTMKPWLLSKGNCLRTQMINFCELKESSESAAWNYEGGNVEMLIRMVKANVGYTLVPNFYIPLLAERECDFKKIISFEKQSPARSVIGLVQHKNTKWDSIQKIIRSVQHTFNQSHTNDMLLLEWK